MNDTLDTAAHSRFDNDGTGGMLCVDGKKSGISAQRHTKHYRAQTQIIALAILPDYAGVFLQTNFGSET